MKRYIFIGILITILESIMGWQSWNIESTMNAPTTEQYQSSSKDDGEDGTTNDDKDEDSSATTSRKGT